MKLVQIMGSGCARCNETTKIVEAALAEYGLEARLEKVTDFSEMARLGVFSTPAVAVDGVVKSVGKIPKQSDVLSWLKA